MLGALLLGGCSDPQQPPSMGGAPAPSEARRLAESSDAAITQPPAWVAAAHPSELLECYVDVVEGAERTPGGWQVAAHTALLSGWSVKLDQKQQPPALLLLQGPNTYVFKAVRSQRDDVTQAEQFRVIAPADPGVAVPLWLEGVVPGTYRMSLVVGEAAEALRCDLGEANQLLVR
ncbi:hypothetical protein P6166_09765 [Stenotrophomonas sp. HITSZ_GD]|uniref:hypothetical protein n=1 Tax=Stenotrophomonas sp. HITSZ_GD TaxID=3037248 RepID=UPI00240E56F9|nr:hypothetical protein [Stenotrophomonas sp. HITSZ_GD]MDG2525640.1 hypothetical protein [Stenotrophomonas sp. HITSZ_GD]